MTSLRPKRYTFCAGLILLGGALLLGMGCGKKSNTADGSGASSEEGENGPKLPLVPPGKGELTGKISHKGEPIVAGRLFFIHDKGFVMSPGRIFPDGTYKAVGLPEGEVRIFVLLDPNGEMPFPSLPQPAMRPSGPMGAEGAGPAGGPAGAMPPPPPMPGPGGMPGFPRIPGRPGGKGRGNGPPMPNRMPPTLPPFVVQKMKEFRVPPDKQELYKELHEKYGRLTDDNKIKTVIKEGANTLDIDLP
jgi:hypothetical protein